MCQYKIMRLCDSLEFRMIINNCNIIMQIKYTQQTATPNYLSSHYSNKKHNEIYLADLQRICQLDLILRPISILTTDQNLQNLKKQKQDISTKHFYTNKNNNKKQKHQQLINQFSQHQKHSQLKQEQQKREFSPSLQKLNGTQDRSKRMQSNSNLNKSPRQPAQYSQSIGEISIWKTKRNKELKQSTVTFSPLRIDISLPSLSSEDLNELKQEKQIICEIENDIKVLIRKIHANHGGDENNCKDPAKNKYQKPKKKWK